MDIGHIKGQGPIDRPGGRGKAGASERADAKDAPQVDGQRADGAEQVLDRAVISAKGKETLAALQALTDRAKADEGDRAEIVAAARERLAAGALDDPAVLRKVASNLLDQGLI